VAVPVAVGVEVAVAVPVGVAVEGPKLGGTGHDLSAAEMVPGSSRLAHLKGPRMAFQPTLPQLPPSWGRQRSEFLTS
jgi:hypothetical protein